MAPDQKASGRLDRAMRATAAVALIGALGLAVSLCAGDDARLFASADGGGAGGPAAALAARPSLVRAGPGGIDQVGAVVDAAGRPVASVAIAAFPEDALSAAPPAPDAALAVALSAVDGSFTLTGLPPGHYRLRVSGVGVIAAEVRFVELPAGEVRLLIARAIEISGAVREGGAAAAGVRVFARPVDGGAVAEVESDAAGAFRLAGLAEGVYHVWAAAGTRAARAARVSALGIERPPPVSLLLEPGALVEGVVVDAATGRAIEADVRVTADDSEERDEPVRVARSDEDGVFCIEGVPLGSWAAEASAPGYVMEAASVFVAGRAPLRLPLVAGAVVSGRVVGPDGGALAGAMVAVEDEDGVAAAPLGASVGGDRLLPRGELGVMVGPVPYPPPAPAALRVAAPLAGPAPLEVDPSRRSSPVTGPDGRYRIVGLGAGRYRVRASHPDHVDGVSRRISVELGGEQRGVDIALARGRRLRGLVRDPSGAAVVGAEIVASPGVGARADQRRGYSDPAGRFAVGPVAGAATLRVRAPAHGEARLEIAAGDDRDHVVVLERADASARGRVVDPAGLGVSGATVELAGGRTQTDAGGHFLVTGLVLGEHAARIVHPDAPPREVTLSTTSETRVELDWGGGIAGEVRDRATGAALADVAIAAAGPRGLVAEARSGGDGGFRLTALAEGRWTLAFTRRGHVAASREVDVTAARGARETTVRDLRVELARGATVAGTVRDARGERVAGATVAIGPARARTDADGRFRIVDAPSGDVELVASEGERAGRATLSLVPGGEIVTFEVRIE